MDARREIFWSLATVRAHIKRADGSRVSIRQLQYDYAAGLLPPSVLWHATRSRIVPLYRPSRVREIARSRGWRYLPISKARKGT